MLVSYPFPPVIALLSDTDPSFCKSIMTILGAMNFVLLRIEGVSVARRGALVREVVIT
jgi:hypothetical protein